MKIKPHRTKEVLVITTGPDGTVHAEIFFDPQTHTERGIPFVQQRRFEIRYKGKHVGLYVPDLIAFDKVVVEAKAIENITDQDLGQIMNYLRISELAVGLVLNFKRPRLEFRRVVMSENIR